MVKLTDDGKPYQKTNPEDHENHVEEEVLVIVHSNTVIHPWTMAVRKSGRARSTASLQYLLILSCHAPPATPAMLAS